MIGAKAHFGLVKKNQATGYNDFRLAPSSEPRRLQDQGPQCRCRDKRPSPKIPKRTCQIILR